MWPPRQGERADDGFVWPDLSEADLSGFVVENARGRFECVRQEGGWAIRVPGAGVKPRAKSEKVKALLDFLTENKPLRMVGTLGESELDEYGLLEPRATFTAHSPLSWELRVGERNPTSDGVYARSSREPDSLLLLDTEFAIVLGRGADHYFDKNLFAFDREKVRALRGRGPDSGAWELRRGGEGDGWVFSAPEKAKGWPVSQTEVDYFLHTLGTIKAAELLVGRGEPAGDPSLVVEVELAADGEEAVQRLTAYPDGGNGPPWLGVSTSQPVPAGLDEQRFEQLNRSAFSLRDRRVITLDLSRVQRMRLDGARADLLAHKGDSVWRDNQGAEIVGLDVLLWRLTDVRYQREPVVELPEGAERALTWELMDEEGERLLKLAFFRDNGLEEGQYWLKNDNTGEFYPVCGGLLKDLTERLPSPGTGE
ncbi:DUF4340 domain-containing protein [Desulfohalovibrio reitneri]|uniref:DUF4340 domain-containing protein n=1 Tax=Desulfohalovibrio reitneri TaxID=1307759 RepID=UPI0013781DF0|nr:DUF4340 domain-containing protein [Desulfohalovibrio reitneri]